MSFNKPDLDLNKLMQQTKAMQTKLQETQKELANLEVTGEAAAGDVKVTVFAGNHNIKQIIIADTIYEEADKNVLADLIAAATNDAIHKAEKITKEKMAGLAAGLNLPFDLNNLGGMGS
ncbi:MAG: YbaB/EbfC family nucleoid-associated protein [Gammaproteobacteria bacterium]